MLSGRKGEARPQKSEHRSLELRPAAARLRSANQHVGCSCGGGCPRCQFEVTRGRPLETRTRALMEAHFSRDFSGVRIHDDAGARASNRAAQAAAYTVG